MSDWWAMKNKTAGSVSGLDMNMAGNNPGGYSPAWDDADFARMGRDGVHDSVRRYLWGMLSSGAFDLPDKTCVPGLDANCKDMAGVDVTNQAHTKLAREVAAASTVMLQNDGILPIPRASRVLVLGSACFAEPIIDTSKDWDKGDYYVNGGSGRVLSDRTATVFDGIREANLLNKGPTPHQGPKDDNLTMALEVLRNSEGLVDAVIACGGVTNSEGWDRDSLQLDQHDFLVELASENAKLRDPFPLIIITMSGGAILTDFRENASAVLSVFLSGQNWSSSCRRGLWGS